MNSDDKVFLNQIVNEVAKRSGAHRALGKMIDHMRHKDPQASWERDNAIIKILEKVRDHLGNDSLEKINDQ